MASVVFIEEEKVDLEKERMRLIDEAEQLRKIFSAILIKLNEK